jgi:Putative peptidoglycan binding domain
VGAWGTDSHLDLAGGFYQFVIPTLKGAGVKAVKRELDYNGFNLGMDLSNNAFGIAVKHSAIAFQQANGLTADGVVGPLTAHELFRKRCALLTSTAGIHGSVFQVASLESAMDPWAYGFVDPDDHGLVQINLRVHPTISLKQALDPAYCLSYCGRALQSVFDVTGDIDVAVASWNVGVGGAKEWLAAGKPATGGTSDFPDLYNRATRYVSLVQTQPTL